MSEEWDHNDENAKPKKLLSRRKLLAAAGLTGAAAISGSLLSGRLNLVQSDETHKPDRSGGNQNLDGSESFVENDVVNVKKYGAVGDGTVDDTQAIQTAIEALPQGGTVFFPVGTYLITKSISIQSDSITMIGQNKSSKIIYTYEQKDNDSNDTASLFVFRDGIKDVIVRDLNMQYTGNFFVEVGQSYAGKVAGLKFSQCYDVLIEQVEVSGFNASGIMQNTGSNFKYAQRMKIHQCYLHHNRVAGLLFGNVEQISITDCDLDYNGSEQDGGTGYGLAGSSSELPKRVQIMHNRASYNYRKGIDLHAGISAVIEGNVCHANRLYGIYAVGNKTGNIIIRGNIISGMAKEKIGLPKPYTWIAGINIGPHPEENQTVDNRNYLIEGNLFTDFGAGDGDAYPIDIYSRNNRGMVQIKNNIINADRITNLVVVRASAQPKREVKLDISGNQAFIKECTDYTMSLPHCTYVTIHSNQITTNQSQRKDGFIKVNDDSLRGIVYTGNQLNDPQNSYEQAITGLDNDVFNQKTVRSGNFLNGVLVDQ